MVTAIESERKTPVEKVEKIFRENGNCLIRGTYNIKEALEEALCWTDGGGMLVCTGSLYLAGSLKAWRKDDPMIDFDEEIKKFKPSLEVGDVEEAIEAGDLKDMMGIMEAILNLLADKRR